MNCPKCEHDKSDILFTDKRPATILWRKRRCKLCGYEWQTSEMEDERMELTPVWKDGVRV